eukprot:SAG11_NODE_25258_length_361_cov_0.980916_1_plen_81_part_10
MGGPFVVVVVLLLLLPQLRVFAPSDMQLEGWVAVADVNLTVHVAVGLLNRKERRPAAMYTGVTWECSHVWLKQAQRFDPTA